MFISKLRLVNFKRFNDLTLDLSDVQPPPKLVLLVGANGSGKTSVFDAFEWLSRYQQESSLLADENIYYKKEAAQSIEAIAEFTNGQAMHRRDTHMVKRLSQPAAFYGRSSLRQVPQLTRTGQSSTVDIGQDSDRPRRYIERDQRFENDIDMLTVRVLEEVFVGDDFDAARLRKQYIDPVNNALSRIFGNDKATALSLRTLIPARNGKVADIRFRKGQSDIHYDLLSSGEKEVVNILFNLFIRRETFRDTVYVIDELDVHLNTALQYALLKEITEQWIPEGCQLWTASHSLGFIEYAHAAAHAVLLDFDQLDFDQPMTLVPAPRASRDVIEIAVPSASLAQVFRGKKITYCENQDVSLYYRMNDPDRVFLPAKDKNDVYFAAKNNPQVYALMDRDYMTDMEVQALCASVTNLRVLGLYSIENYLYHPDNIAEVNAKFDRDAWKSHLHLCARYARDNVLLGLNQTRAGYKALTAEKIFDPKNEQLHKGNEEIAAALASAQFEIFYPFLDVKEKVDRAPLAKLNVSPDRLAQTDWFRNAIQQVLNP